MTCECCDRARISNDYAMFSPACMHCGARLIQRIGKLPIAQSAATKRRQAVLADWISMGHQEDEIRNLVKGPLALAPVSSNEPAKRGK